MKLVTLLAVAFLSIAAVPNDRFYEVSPAQLKVDQSFSDIPIETPLEEVKHRLTEVVVHRCQEYSECDWKDAAGVRHFAFEFGDDLNPDYLIVVKSVHADEFVGKPIAALGIGMARSRAEVIANVQAFLADVELECEALVTLDGIEDQCGATLLPGWIRIWFDEQGQLREARFDGFHFT